MASFSDLDQRSLPKLLQKFASEPALGNGVPADDRDYYAQELAREIAENGEPGLTYLLHELPKAGPVKRRAILLGLTFAPGSAVAAARQQIKTALLSHLGDDPLVAAEAIDSLSSLRFTECAKDVEALLDHESAYVVGGVLRFLSRHDPQKAKPLLIKSLASPSPILRQNAIDELDELHCTEALPQIRRLLADPDPEVRQAAETAVADLDDMGTA